MALTRQAVDKTTEEYWIAYFKEYGKAWVRKIPMRIAAAIVDVLSKAARTGVSPRIARARIAPLGFAETNTGGLTFEGVFRGMRADGAETVTRLFAAEFDASGKMIGLSQIAG